MNRLKWTRATGLIAAVILVGCQPGKKAETLDDLVAGLKKNNIVVDSTEPLPGVKFDGVTLADSRQVKGPDLLLDMFLFGPGEKPKIGNVETTERAEITVYQRNPFVVVIHKQPAGVDMIGVFDTMFPGEEPAPR